MRTTVNNAPSVFVDLMLTYHLSKVCTTLLDRGYVYIKCTFVLDKRQVICRDLKMIVVIDNVMERLLIRSESRYIVARRVIHA